MRVRVGLDGFPFGGICACAADDFVEVVFHVCNYTATRRVSCQPLRFRLYSTYGVSMSEIELVPLAPAIEKVHSPRLRGFALRWKRVK